MILKSRRSYKRESPSRDAKSIYIFCEGARREYEYFKYFKELDSRINVEIYELDSQEDNSPLGLLEIAKESILPGEKNSKPKYSFLEDDEVWLVFDRDHDRGNSRAPQIETIRNDCKKRADWFIGLSNPCFEVWLYYHFSGEKPSFTGDDRSCNWKTFVHDVSNGGFDSRKHPVLIEQAIVNASMNFTDVDGEPTTGSTEVFKLAKTIFTFVRDKLSDE